MQKVTLSQGSVWPQPHIGCNFLFFFFFKKRFIYYLFIYLIYFWLCRVLVAARGIFVEACEIFRCGTRASL